MSKSCDHAGQSGTSPDGLSSVTAPDPADDRENFYLEGLKDILPAPTTAPELGRRAARLREYLGLSVSEVAARAEVEEDEIARFERTGEGTVALLLALANEISSGGELDRILNLPQFSSIDEVVAWERTRIARCQRPSSK